MQSTYDMPRLRKWWPIHGQYGNAARRSTRALRLARCCPRRTRLRRITSAVCPGRAVKFFASGIRPAATYGAEVTGVAIGALPTRSVPAPEAARLPRAAISKATPLATLATLATPPPLGGPSKRGVRPPMTPTPSASRNSPAPSTSPDPTPAAPHGVLPRAPSPSPT